MIPIKTDIATHYLWRQIITAVICVVLSVWGWYDLTVSIPREEELATAYATLNAERVPLEEKQNSLAERGLTLSSGELADLEALSAEIERITDAAGGVPTAPSALDWLVQWMFIGCILWVPWCLWQILRIKKNPYTLDADGTLHIPGEEPWPAEQIAGINMDRWMAKSVAWVEHTDGRTHKMDAYLRKHMEHIIGTLAHRFDPEHWNPDGTKVTDDDDDVDEAVQAETEAV